MAATRPIALYTSCIAWHRPNNRSARSGAGWASARPASDAYVAVRFFLRRTVTLEEQPEAPGSEVALEGIAHAR